MRIIFMGTPDFAVPCLRALIDDGHDVCAVFTQPDKPKGRHATPAPPPVKLLAVQEGIPVFQPSSLRTRDAAELFRSLDAQLAIVVAYGKILPQELLQMPAFGCINMHASLLPKLRGAAPIQWAVINGERHTGVTAMQMDAGLDTGDMLCSRSLDIGENETAGELHDRLSVLGAQVMLETLTMLGDGALKPVRQEESLSSYAPMLTKELSRLDWSRSAKQLHNQIRGLYPWPGAFAVLGGKQIKIHASSLAAHVEAPAGEVVENKNRLVVACGDKQGLVLEIIQAPGKKAMSAADYMRGNPIELGTIFE